MFRFMTSLLEKEVSIGLTWQSNDVSKAAQIFEYFEHSDRSLLYRARKIDCYIESVLQHINSDEIPMHK